MSRSYAPDVRVEIRDAEWRTKCVDRTSDGGELLTIYRVQFPVMRQYEADTWYDQNGRIIFTPSKGLVDVGLPRTARKADAYKDIQYGIDLANPDPDIIAQYEVIGWNDIKDLTACDTVSKTYTDTTQSIGPIERTIVYEAPFFKPNRKEDYAVARCCTQN